MKTYRIIVLNSVNCEAFNALFNAETENEALKMFLQDNEIYSGDSIQIDEE